MLRGGHRIALGAAASGGAPEVSHAQLCGQSVAFQAEIASMRAQRQGGAGQNRGSGLGQGRGAGQRPFRLPTPKGTKA